VTTSFLAAIGIPTISSIVYIKHKESSKNKFNIVFDLDKTLIDSTCDDEYKYNYGIRDPDFDIIFEECEEYEEPEEYNVWIRPFTHFTLRTLNKFTDVHLFTSSTQDYADAIIDNMFPYESPFQKKLYSDSCSDIKNLSLLDLKNESILIDDKSYWHKKGQDFYHIKQFHHQNTNDYELLKILPCALYKSISMDISRIFDPNKNNKK